MAHARAGSTSAPPTSHYRKASNVSAKAPSITTHPSAEVHAEATPTDETVVVVPSTLQAADPSATESIDEPVVTTPSTESEAKLEKSPMKRNRASFTLASAALPNVIGPVEAHAPAALSGPTSASVEGEGIGTGVEAEDEEVEEVDSETEDTIQPLADPRSRLEPIQIPSKGAGSRSELPMSATSVGTAQTGLTATTESEMIVTPTSMMTSLVTGRSPSESPPRYDPIVDSPPHTSAELGRKESKWRKSFMGLGANVSFFCT